MASITDAEWQTLEDGLDTPAILRAVDAMDRLRSELANPTDEGELLVMRDELLQLHRLAQRVSGRSADIRELFDVAQDLELQIDEWIDALAGIQSTVSTVTALYPESLAYED